MARLVSAILIFAGILFFEIDAIPRFAGSEDEEVIDLSHFGPRLFGTPSNKTGDLVAKWSVHMKMNPEELGGYLEGDILHPASMKKTSGLIWSSSRWVNATVPYVIAGTYTTAQLNLIQAAIADFHALTCVRFVPRTNQIDFVIITDTTTGCWSPIGRLGGAQLLNLQSPGCVTLKGTVIHEFMHTLGFIHEHSRPGRDIYVAIQWFNIDLWAILNFAEYPGDWVSNFGEPYDYGSVMHYGSYAFSWNGQPTIIPTQVCSAIGQRIGMSPADVRSVRTMYNCH